MNAESFKKALEKVKQGTRKRKFVQSYDLVLNLAGLNLKKAEEQIDIFAVLPYPKGKKAKVCCIVGSELTELARKSSDLTIITDDFPKYEGVKKEQKKLASSYDFFVAQANIMPQIAKTFGKVLGQKGKMPNPKAGCVVSSNANLKALYNQLQHTVRLTAKTQLSIKCMIGTEQTADEQVVENALAVYDALIKALPKEKQNIKNVLLKLTMGHPIMVGEHD